MQHRHGCNPIGGRDCEKAGRGREGYTTGFLMCNVAASQRAPTVLISASVLPPSSASPCFATKLMACRPYSSTSALPWGYGGEHRLALGLQ